MAAIQVYKTDTFEIQRQKINEIGIAISGFSGGGNDFAAGNLKLGDGERLIPSLSFTSDNTLGLYKPSPETMGIVSGGRNIAEFNSISSIFFKDAIVQKNSLSNAQFRIDSRGTEYDSGTFLGVPLTGGTGTDATANITVTRFVGSITNLGKNYTPGNYTLISLVGGSGTGTTASFSVDSIVGDITPGSGYTFGAYENVSLSGGSGSGAVVDILSSQDGEITQVIFKSIGSDYETGDVLTADVNDIGGTGSGFEYTITSDPGVIKNFTFSTKGDGYSPGDVIGLPKTVSGLSSTLSTSSTTISVSNVSGISPGYFVTVSSGSGSLRPNTSVLSTDPSANTVVLSSLPQTAGSAVLDFTPPFGDPASDFEYTISNVGEVSNFSISSGGSGYLQDDVLSVDPKRLVSPTTYMVGVYEVRRLFIGTTVAANFLVPGNEIAYGEGSTTVVHAVTNSGGNLESIIIDNVDIADGEQINNAADAPSFETFLDVASSDVFFATFMDLSGAGTYTYAPNLTVAPGNTYIFSLFDTSNEDHTFSLSEYPGGIWGTSYIQDVTSSVDISTSVITVSDSTGIVAGMSVVVESGPGNLVTSTKVVSVDSSTEITIDTIPLATGSCVLSFRGVEYTTNVTRTPEALTLAVTDETPQTLYYYCSVEEFGVNHSNEGGIPGYESTITNNLANARTTFGSGFQVTVADIEPENVIICSASNGNISSTSLTSSEGAISLINSESIFSTTTETENLICSSIAAVDDDITLSATNLSLSSNVIVGNNVVTIQRLNGNIVTSGSIKTLSTINVSDNLLINQSDISGTSAQNISLTPSSGRTVKVNTSTALVIPVGTNNQRPQTGVVETGAIRYNTTTQQFEGFSNVSGTAAWSSLGGIRDVDGNTYILAEASTGANDNTFYFFNNDQNTLRLTTQFLDFRTTKKIRSENMSAPAYVNWVANAFVSEGDFIRYKTNIYEVVSIVGSGQLAGSANPPTHDVGGEFNNEAFLARVASAVDSITFEEVASVQIDPNGVAPLVINNELNLEAQYIRTNVNDLILFPASGKKVEVSAQSSLVIPVGDNNQRGSAKRGSIRFNTDILQYEGYDGTNWSSLGGVRDVDGNTYIIPELGPGTNENILYFYNDDNNTLQLSTSGLDFYSTDNITSSQSDTLNINVSNVTFDTLGFSIDNSGTSTVLASTKETINFNLSTGLTTEKLLSFTSDGEIIVNSRYSFGDVADVTVLDSELQNFELSDIKVSTEDISLTRGTINTGSTIVYDPSIHFSGKLSIVVENVTKNEKELVEFNVCHKGTDIFYTEYGNISTNGELIATVFDFNASNQIRATFTLNTVNNDVGDNVNIVAIKTFIKK